MKRWLNSVILRLPASVLDDGRFITNHNTPTTNCNNAGGFHPNFQSTYLRTEEVPYLGLIKFIGLVIELNNQYILQKVTFSSDY